MRAKTGVKLAYKQSAPCGYAFVPVFTSDGHPMPLVRPWPGKKMPAVLNYYKKTMKEGEAVVEFDNFKHTLSTYDKPLVEVRDSL